MYFSYRSCCGIEKFSPWNLIFLQSRNTHFHLVHHPTPLRGSSSLSKTSRFSLEAGAEIRWQGEGGSGGVLPAAAGATGEMPVAGDNLDYRAGIILTHSEQGTRSMPPADLLFRPSADSKNLITVREVPALVRCLADPYPATRKRAADALIAIGTPAVPGLQSALQSPRALERLGAIEVLAAIRDPASAGSLIAHLEKEKHSELMCAVIFALGEIGSPGAISCLVPLLSSNAKYLRFAAAVSLDRLGWEPEDERNRLRYRIARWDWDAVRKAGPAAVPLLCAIPHDPDPVIRSRIISLIGEIGAGEGCRACEAGMRDRDPNVRWASVLAAMNCGIAPARMPVFLASRERAGPNPVAAGILNFLFLGLGYNYIGKWWGFPVFMAYMSVIVLAQLATGPFLPYLVAYPVTAVLGLHTYYLARRTSDRG